MTPKFLRSEVLPYASIEVIPAGTPAPVVVCAWCRGFDPATSKGVSHGICDACAAEMTAAFEAREIDNDDDDDSGRACGAGCGYCGRCS